MSPKLINILVIVAGAIAGNFVWVSYRGATGAYDRCVYANVSFYQGNGIAVTLTDLDTIRYRCAWQG
jgi:hypothetical protein